MTTGPFDRFRGGPPRIEARHAPGRHCDVQASGAIELFFYDELDVADRDGIAGHLKVCRQCRAALDEMHVIREALAAQPTVSSPPAGDWSGFMARLDSAIQRDTAVGDHRLIAFPRARTARRAWIPAAATAALVAIVAGSVMAVWHARARRLPPAPRTSVVLPVPSPTPTPTTAPVDEGKAALAALSEQHLERSKLVVLGLANKDAGQVTARDWYFERQLASDLLTDTRLYRLAAEGRGMDDVARVMRDLELVLLQTSMSADHEPETLAQIQRLIRKRDLVGRMTFVSAAGL